MVRTRRIGFTLTGTVTAVRHRGAVAQSKWAGFTRDDHHAADQGREGPRFTPGVNPDAQTESIGA